MHFVAGSSVEGETLLRQHGLGRPESVVVIEHGRVSMRSHAVISLLRGLPNPWRLAAVLLCVLPAGLVDLAYGIVARNRYRWFGRADTCAREIPSGYCAVVAGEVRADCGRSRMRTRLERVR